MKDFSWSSKQGNVYDSLLVNHTRMSKPKAKNLMDLRKDMRQQRKGFLGSYISLRKYIKEKSAVEENPVETLCDYLTKRTKCFWENTNPNVEEFIYRFYNLTICCLLKGDLSYECIDDIIQLAECLIRSRTVFVIAAKEMLPSDMIGELFDFTEQYDDSYFSVTFEDAVLGAVSVLLGALEDPYSINDSRGAE